MRAAKTRADLLKDVEDYRFELSSAEETVKWWESNLADAKRKLAEFDLKDAGSDLFAGKLRLRLDT